MNLRLLSSQRFAARRNQFAVNRIGMFCPDVKHKSLARLRSHRQKSRILGTTPLIIQWSVASLINILLVRVHPPWRPKPGFTANLKGGTTFNCVVPSKAATLIDPCLLSTLVKFDGPLDAWSIFRRMVANHVSFGHLCCQAWDQSNRFGIEMMKHKQLWLGNHGVRRPEILHLGIAQLHHCCPSIYFPKELTQQHPTHVNANCVNVQSAISI